MINDELAFGKDAACEILKGCTYNWRHLLMILGSRLHGFLNRLTNENRKAVLIVDDSPYDRSRSKKVERLSRVWGHSKKRYFKGCRMLTDGWFAMPSVVTALKAHIDVIGMVKKTPKIHYGCKGHQTDLMAIYRKLKKRPGRARILASTIVTLKKGLPVKLVFVRDKRKKDWLALMSTDLELPNEEIIRIYGKRWDIEVFSKLGRQHLKRAKEIRRDLAMHGLPIPASCSCAICFWRTSAG